LKSESPPEDEPKTGNPLPGKAEKGDRHHECCRGYVVSRRGENNHVVEGCRVGNGKLSGERQGKRGKGFVDPVFEMKKNNLKKK